MGERTISSTRHPDSAMTFSYEYPRPALTVDAVLLSRDTPRQVLLIKRRKAPFAECWALPGGFFDLDDESAESAAARELEEETGLANIPLAQFYTFSESGRDPRERVVSIAHLAEVDRMSLEPQAADDAKEVAWHSTAALPPLAFDHSTVIQKALQALAERL